MRRRIERHHVAGACNSELIAPLCVGCHIKLTRRQAVWDARWTQKENSKNLRMAFLEQGFRELYLLKYEATGDVTYQELADALCYIIGKHLVKI